MRESPWPWLLPVLIVPPLALCAAWMVAQSRHAAGAIGRWSFARPGRDDAGWILSLLMFLAGYVYVMFYGDELVGIDFAHLTVNRWFEAVVYPESGRMFPLALQAYNLLNVFGKSAPLYHAWAAIELLVLVSCVLFLLRDLPRWHRVLATVFLLTLPSIAFAFMGLLYVERDMVFCVALWLVAVESFRRTKSPVAFAAAIVLAQLLLYQKETSCVLVGGFAGASVLVRGGFQASRFAEWTRANALELAHLALCAVFALVYIIAILPHVTASYVAGENAAGAWSRVMYIVRYHPLLVVAGAMLLLRVRNRQTLDDIWDPMVLGAIAFAVAYMTLALMREYYLAPADFIAALYVARIVHETLPAWPRVAVAGLCLVLTALFTRNVGTAAVDWIGRRSSVDAYVQLAAVLRREADSRPDRTITLFFPQPGGFQVMEFAAFLYLKGWTPTDGPVPRGAHGPGFILRTSHRFPGDRCFMSQPFRCRMVLSPDAGDLIVFLPAPSIAETSLARWRERADAVFHHEPRRSLTMSVMRALARAGGRDVELSEAYVFRSRPQISSRAVGP